jgi:hypothetical protein
MAFSDKEHIGVLQDSIVRRARKKRKKKVKQPKKLKKLEKLSSVQAAIDGFRKSAAPIGVDWDSDPYATDASVPGIGSGPEMGPAPVPPLDPMQSLAGPEDGGVWSPKGVSSGGGIANPFDDAPPPFDPFLVDQQVSPADIGDIDPAAYAQQTRDDLQNRVFGPNSQVDNLRRILGQGGAAVGAGASALGGGISDVAGNIRNRLSQPSTGSLPAVGSGGDPFSVDPAGSMPPSDSVDITDRGGPEQVVDEGNWLDKAQRQIQGRTSGALGHISEGLQSGYDKMPGWAQVAAPIGAAGAAGLGAYGLYNMMSGEKDDEEEKKASAYPALTKQADEFWEGPPQSKEDMIRGLEQQTEEAAAHKIWKGLGGEEPIDPVVDPDAGRLPVPAMPSGPSTSPDDGEYWNSDISSSPLETPDPFQQAEMEARGTPFDMRYDTTGGLNPFEMDPTAYPTSTAQNAPGATDVELPLGIDQGAEGATDLHPSEQPKPGMLARAGKAITDTTRGGLDYINKDLGAGYDSMHPAAKIGLPLAMGGLGAYGLYNMMSGEDEEEEKHASYPALTKVAFGDETPIAIGDGDTPRDPGWKTLPHVYTDDLKRLDAPPEDAALRMLRATAGGSALGAAGLPGAVGAIGGGLYGALSPGEDEEGNERSRIMQALKMGLLGGGLGAGAGLIGAGGAIAGGALGAGREAGAILGEMDSGGAGHEVRSYEIERYPALAKNANMMVGSAGPPSVVNTTRSMSGASATAGLPGGQGISKMTTPAGGQMPTDNTEPTNKPTGGATLSRGTEAEKTSSIQPPQSATPGGAANASFRPTAGSYMDELLGRMQVDGDSIDTLAVKLAAVAQEDPEAADHISRFVQQFAG